MNSQTTEIIPLKMGNKTMITPGARDALKFSSKKPQEIRRFLRQMEDLWREAGIIDDAEKKEGLGKYADHESEEEWKALENYESGNTWEEFKNELIFNYPEAAAAEHGTPARLKQMCGEAKGIQLGDLTTLYAFQRSFLAEAKKLTKLPVAMSNRELVELFIGSLSETMAAALLQFLGNRAVSKIKLLKEEKQTGITDKIIARRPEDRYDLEEVCKAAIQVSENSQGMFHFMNKALPEPASERRVMMFDRSATGTSHLTQKLEEVENIQVQERDKLALANKNMDTKFNELQDMMKTMLAKVQGEERVKDTCQNETNRENKLGAPGMIPKWGAGGSKSEGNGKCCYYCGCINHFIPECEEMKDDLKAGLVKLNTEGKLRMSDGSYIPNVPNTVTIKERVEKSLAKRQSQFYLGTEEDNAQNMPSLSVLKNPAQYTNMVEDAAQRQTRLEKELELKEKEEELEIRQIKLEKETKKRQELSHRTTHAAQVLDLLEQLTEEEVAAITTVKLDFH